MEDTPITQSDAGLCPERFIDFILLVLRYADQNIRPWNVEIDSFEWVQASS